jgi:hypothetical protein
MVIRHLLRFVLFMTVSLAYGYHQWERGYEIGAVQMQCIDTIALFGPKEGLKEDACVQAKAKKWRADWHL